MDLVSTLNPCMEELRLSQTKARARLKKAQAEWEKRREMLDMILPLDVPGEGGGLIHSQAGRRQAEHGED